MSLMLTRSKLKQSINLIQLVFIIKKLAEKLIELIIL